MEGLKQKALKGAKWSLLEKVINIGFELGVGIVLARILLPTDFGTVAIISVIISFSLIFVNSGFNQSLIRDPDVDNKDFSTIFFFNLIVGLLSYCLIFLFSSSIASFYGDNELGLYLKILGLSILISSLTLVQRVCLTREMNFKLMSKISILSSLLSGVLALAAAFSGFGIWSLIIKTLSRELLQSIFFWLNNNWKPSIVFDKTILKRHFRYGSNFLASAIIGQIYNNILALAIGRIFNLQTLGYYNRAQLFSNSISENVSGVMTNVSFPALAKVQDDKEKFIVGVRLLLRQAFFVTGILAVLVFFSAKVFIPSVLGDHWVRAGELLQYLSVIGFLGVMNSILVNSIAVIGRSKLYLQFQICALILSVFSLTVGYFCGIELMLTILILCYAFLYVIISHVFNQIFRYSILDQFNDYRAILKVISSIILIGIILAGFENSFFMTTITLLTQLTCVYVVSSVFKLNEYLLLKDMIIRNNKK